MIALAAEQSVVGRDIATICSQYASDETRVLISAASDMVKAGLWIELDVTTGSTVGLGLGSLTGQRTISTIF